MAEDMIERVGRRLWNHSFDRMPDPPWEQATELQKRFNRMLAREAIAEIGDWTDEQIDAATRVFCAGLPLETHPQANSLAGMIAKGRCLAPNCDCWEEGRAVTRAALEAAAAIHKQTGERS
jgi:hypothetical protein